MHIKIIYSQVRQFNKLSLKSFHRPSLRKKKKKKKNPFEPPESIANDMGKGGQFGLVII